MIPEDFFPSSESPAELEKRLDQELATFGLSTEESQQMRADILALGNENPAVLALILDSENDMDFIRLLPKTVKAEQGSVEKFGCAISFLRHRNHSWQDAGAQAAYSVRSSVSSVGESGAVH